MKPEYIAGFFDGEGSLILRIRKDPRYKAGFQIKANIDIAQKNPNVLKMIKRELNMGKIYKNTDGVWHFCIYRTDDIIKFLQTVNKHVIVKKDKTKKLLKCMKIFNNKKHLSNSGFQKLKKIWFARKSEANIP